MLLTDFKHIIWDWNGTLFDDAKLTLTIMNEMLSKRDLPQLSPEYYAEVFDFPVSDYYSRIDWDFEKHDFESLSDEFIEQYYARHKDYPLRDGAEYILKNNSIPQSILTASAQKDIDALLEHFGLTGLFQGVHGLVNHHAAGKLDIGRSMVRQIDIDPGDILMIGDTTHDAVLAAELGMACALLPSGHQNTSRLEKCSVPIISSLWELIPDDMRPK